MLVEIRSKQDGGHYRLGRHWPTAAQLLDLPSDDVDALKKDKRLIVKEPSGVSLDDIAKDSGPSVKLSDALAQIEELKAELRQANVHLDSAKSDIASLKSLRLEVQARDEKIASLEKLLLDTKKESDLHKSRAAQLEEELTKPSPKKK